ncbi:hypothetical protein QTP86_004622 [Hemibagrus guttatus]|nr:hypothetical protein QTP86_004622 [Hemibagrus guttatus]
MLHKCLKFTLAEQNQQTLRVNPRKSDGPTNIPGRVLRECAEQLSDVFTDIFNISLSSAVVPMCLKTMTIVPVREAHHEAHQDPVTTLTGPIADYILSDAITTTPHLSLTHLDNKDTYVRMLFIDFSSAFNTNIPQHLIEKLNLLGPNTFSTAGSWTS